MVLLKTRQEGWEELSEFLLFGGGNSDRPRKRALGVLSIRWGGNVTAGKLQDASSFGCVIFVVENFPIFFFNYLVLLFDRFRHSTVALFKPFGEKTKSVCRFVVQYLHSISQIRARRASTPSVWSCFHGEVMGLHLREIGRSLTSLVVSFPPQDINVKFVPL